MPCYVDTLAVFVATEPQARRVGARHGHLWCHLVADTREELLAMARVVGAFSDWLQVGRDGFPHFDLTPPRRETAIRMGAKEISRRDVVEIRRRWRARRRAA